MNILDVIVGLREPLHGPDCQGFSLSAKTFYYSATLLIHWPDFLGGSYINDAQSQISDKRMNVVCPVHDFRNIKPEVPTDGDTGHDVQRRAPTCTD